MKKTLASAALAATLAFGMTPALAFAADSASGDPEPSVGTESGDFADKRTGTTEISIVPDASQVNATVPVKISIVAPITGGAVTAPSKEAYLIENNSIFDVYVTSMKAKMKPGFGLVTSDPSGTSSNVGAKGDFMISVNGVTLDPNDAVTITAEQADSFKAMAKLRDDAPAGKLRLDVKGKNSILKEVTAGTPVAVLELSYTVSATKPGTVVNPTPEPSPEPTPDPVA